MPKVSIVIPCYNQGEFIEEAVESALAQTFRDFEIIVVNDGSTDEVTNRLLASFKKPQTSIITTENQGVAMARNTGILHARSEYILPLDADDRIGTTYLEKGVAILDRDPEVGIVYCLAECFGARQGRWDIPDFSGWGMRFTNLIFCSALFRKADWEKAGGFNSNMKKGWEDWDFWLSLLEMDKKVFRIPEPLFYYRVAAGSRERSMGRSAKVEMHVQLMRNHSRLFPFQSRILLELYYLLRDSNLYRMAKKVRIPYLIGNNISNKQ
ncbi:MAG TPA: glycosyltransferase family 2 protein [Desulfuromonadales bacterium]|nr:glycosyltransferase family 2 protein [Desulfuromonadales bacterium]